MVYSEESQEEAAFREYGSLEGAVEAQGAIPAAEVERALIRIEGALFDWENPAETRGLVQTILDIKKAIAQVRHDLGLEKREVNPC